jgi:hypothetical protein
MSSHEPDAAPSEAATGAPPASPSSLGAPGAASARPAALLVVRLTRDDVGARVSVRRRLPAGDAASLSDVVGVLLAWGEDDVLHIERRDATVAQVHRADVVAAKVVPPAAPSRRPAGSP